MLENGCTCTHRRNSCSVGLLTLNSLTTMRSLFISNKMDKTTKSAHHFSSMRRSHANVFDDSPIQWVMDLPSIYLYFSIIVLSINEIIDNGVYISVTKIWTLARQLVAYPCEVCIDSLLCSRFIKKSSTVKYFLYIGNSNVATFCLTKLCIRTFPPKRKID